MVTNTLHSQSAVTGGIHSQSAVTGGIHSQSAVTGGSLYTSFYFKFNRVIKTNQKGLIVY